MKYTTRAWYNSTHTLKLKVVDVRVQLPLRMKIFSHSVKTTSFVEVQTIMMHKFSDV